MTISYEQLVAMTGQGTKVLDELITYMLRKPAKPGQVYDVDAAFTVVLADTLIAMGILQLSVIAFLTWLGSNLITTIMVLRSRFAGKARVLPEDQLIIQILEGRWVLFPGHKMYDLETREPTETRVVPTLSTALNVTVLWQRTVAMYLSPDSEAEQPEAAPPAPGSAP